MSPVNEGTIKNLRACWGRGISMRRPLAVMSLHYLDRLQHALLGAVGIRALHRTDVKCYHRVSLWVGDT